MGSAGLPQGVMISQQDPTFHSYRLECECSSPDDDIFFEIEYDKELNAVNISVQSKMLTKQMSFRRFWLWEKILNTGKRIRIALHVLVTGYYETWGSFGFKSEEQMDALIEMLQRSRREVLESGRKLNEWEDIEEEEKNAYC